MALPTVRPTGVTRHELRRTRLAATGTLGGWGRVQTLGRQTGGKPSGKSEVFPKVAPSPPPLHAGISALTQSLRFITEGGKSLSNIPHKTPSVPFSLWFCSFSQPSFPSAPPYDREAFLYFFPFQSVLSYSIIRSRLDLTLHPLWTHLPHGAKSRRTHNSRHPGKDSPTEV